MTTIYLIRHAEAEGNVFGRIHGHYDSPVTARGREQIACLERRFADVPVDAVYSSDLIRAVRTAEAISLPRALTIHKTPELREIGFGAWEDRTYGELMRTHLQQMLRFSTGALDWKSDGGESMGAVGARMERAVRRIAASHPEQTVCVVSHGTALRLLLTRLTGGGSYLHEGFNTAVSLLEAEGEDIRVIWYNDADHLTDAVRERAVRPNTDVSEQKAAPPNMLWFRRWDPERERELYLTYRREGWLSSHGTMERFDGEAFLCAALAHSRFDPKAVLVVMQDEEPAGFLELDFEKGREERVGAIPFYYLDPAHRCRGGGIQLLGQAVSVYRAMGRNRLRLRCAPENERAYRFYCRNGFVKIGMAEDSVVPLYLMERPIE